MLSNAHKMTSVMNCAVVKYFYAPTRFAFEDNLHIITDLHSTFIF